MPTEHWEPASSDLKGLKHHHLRGGKQMQSQQGHCTSTSSLPGLPAQLSY